MRGVVLLVLLAGTACGRPGQRGDAGRPTYATPAAVPNADVSERWSVYDLSSAWRDQSGATVTLASLKGRPRLMAMIYAHCGSTCPLAIAEMKRVEAKTDSRLGLVLVSLDPDRDSPAALARYAREHDLDAARWTLLNGRDEDVRELAATLGVRYRRLSPNELAHSNTLVLLDADGHVVHRQEGLGERDETTDAALALLR